MRTKSIQITRRGGRSRITFTGYISKIYEYLNLAKRDRIITFLFREMRYRNIKYNIIKTSETRF